MGIVAAHLGILASVTAHMRRSAACCNARLAEMLQHSCAAAGGGAAQPHDVRKRALGAGRIRCRARGTCSARKGDGMRASNDQRGICRLQGVQYGRYDKDSGKWAEVGAACPHGAVHMFAQYGRLATVCFDQESQ
jgi:hypothetical protein